MTTDPTTTPSSELSSSGMTSQEWNSLSGYLPGEAEPTNSVIEAQARAHWQKWRPTELAQMSDQQEFFAELSREAQRQSEDLEHQLAGPDVPGEGYLGKLGRLRMARFDATAVVMRELVLLPPEPGHPDQESEQPTEQSWLLGTPDPDQGWLPVVMTPDHPRYHELDDDPGLSKP